MINNKIKLIIFDLDGVLVSSRDLHYYALNDALREIGEEFVIDRETHLAKFDGLSTTKKLNLLTKERNLSPSDHNKVWRLKQEKTFDLIRQYNTDEKFVSMFKKLKDLGYIISVASNSIRETVKLILLKTGMLEYVDFYYSNEDVKHPKPNVEMYLRSMIKAGVNPKETVIVEDSHIGRVAALNSGAYLYAVKNPDDLEYNKLLNYIDSVNNKRVMPKWQGGNMKVLIPMAGAGSRFLKEGYTFPKPLIPIKNMNDKPMIQVVVENINIDAEYIFLVRKEHFEKYNMGAFLNIIAPKNKVVLVDELTEGAACTTLLAKKYINNDDSLLIANSDQFIQWNSNEFMYSMIGDNIDGGILTFENTHPKWSYVKTDQHGFVTEVKEKEVISNIATCLHYNSPVLMANGKTELLGKIVNQKLETEVLTYNEQKDIFEPKKITGWIKNNNTDNWYKLSYEGSYKTCTGRQQWIYITGDHKVLTETGWKEVQELTPEDKILTKYRTPNALQKSFIDGKLLGDGFYRKPNKKGELGRFVIKQGKIQAEWFNHGINLLKEFPVFINESTGGEKMILNRKCNASGAITGNFGASPVWNLERERWYGTGKKQVPHDLVLHPITLATWYMDDGSLSSKNNRIILRTNSFNKESIEILRKKLLELNIKSQVWKRGGGEIIVISDGPMNNPHNSCFNFLSIIAPFIIPSMQYKIPEAFRDEFSLKNWELGKSNPFFSPVIVQKIINKKKLNKHPNQYCIEVEDNHNFISNNMIVSNCGIYYWTHGRDYVKYAEQMINKNIRVNNEFYVCPVYNEAIKDDKKIKIFNVDKMMGLGTPEDLNYFIANYKE